MGGEERLREHGYLRRENVPAAQRLRGSENAPEIDPWVRSIEDDQTPNERREIARDHPGDDAAPIMSHQGDGSGPPRPDQRDDVGHELPEPVGVTGRRSVGAAVAPQVGHQSGESRIGEWVRLAAPGGPVVREAVEHEHRRSVTDGRDVQLNAITRDSLVTDLPPDHVLGPVPPRRLRRLPVPDRAGLREELPPPAAFAASRWAFRSAFRRADRKSTRLNSSHVKISYAVFCLKKKTYLLVTNLCEVN